MAKPDGIKVLVKKGELTAREAYERLFAFDADGEALNSKTAKWLRKRIAQEVRYDR